MGDEGHFGDYRAQTLAKHTILTKYLKPFYTIVSKSSSKNLVYIDGFAGRGSYDNPDGSTSDGSPLRALKTIAEMGDIAEKVSTVFIEKDSSLFEQLKERVLAFYAENPNIRRPQFANAGFSEVMAKVLARTDQLAPAFVFVDPCGVDGVDFSVVEGILQHPKAEVFLFFNIDGVRRVLGLDPAQRSVLARLLGGTERVTELAREVESLSSAADRELAIVNYYESLLRTHTNGKYVVSFRIEAEKRRSVSHYLTHACQHPMGFSIMKDVMWTVGETDEGQGSLRLDQASITGVIPLFTPEKNAIDDEVTFHLQHGPKSVPFFLKKLPMDPTNRLCRAAYREAILRLEEQGQIVVQADDGTPKPAHERQKRKGKPTLGEAFFVRLK
jgi:three-Cys-motif partner protein